jgi:hypothetical protein
VRLCREGAGIGGNINSGISDKLVQRVGGGFSALHEDFEKLTALRARLHGMSSKSVECLNILPALLLWGCGHAAFPKQLFTVEAPNADYPVMLSRTPSSDAGRPISAESRTQAVASQSSYSIGNTTVSVTQQSASQSELSASVKLAAQVQRSDRWLRLHRAVFRAEDYSTYGFASAERALVIEGTVHQ